MQTLRLDITPEKQLEIISEVASPLVVIAELIKNGYDEGANNIVINIDTNQKIIQVKDNGKGFTEESIKNLATPGDSPKKKNENFYNDHQMFFSGSMGIGFMSVFSIAENIKIETVGKNGTYIVESDGKSFDFFKESNETDNKGSIITLLNVNEKDLKVLTEDIQQDKMKHISIKNYLKEYDVFNLKVIIDKQNYDVNTPSLEKLYEEQICNFTSKVVFSYNKKKQVLLFQIERKETDIINSNPIEIKIDSNLNIKKILKEHYFIKKVSKVSKFSFLPEHAGEVCDFKGTFFIKEGGKGSSQADEFGAAIRLFINGFSMYNYTDKENDWLKLSELSQNVKNTGMKPKNTFGFIAFNKFDENNEELKISRERSHFYDKSPYRAFYEIMYKVVVLLIFNIDVAARNIKEHSFYFEKDHLNKKESAENSDPKESEDNQETDKKLTKHTKPIVEGENIINNVPPEIILKDSYVEPIILHLATNFNPKDFVNAYDQNGEVLQTTIIHNDNFLNIHKVGVYSITYIAKDNLEQTSELVVKFRVIDPNENSFRFEGKGKSLVNPIQAFYFTQEEINSFSYPTGALSTKIQQVIKEMHSINFNYQPIAMTALFRVLIELCCRKVCNSFEKLRFEESNLSNTVGAVLNTLNNKLSKERISNSNFHGEKLLEDKDSKELKNFFSLLNQEEMQGIKKEVEKRSIIDMLNLYMHRENEVTEDVCRFWSRMKPFLLACLRLPE